MNSNNAMDDEDGQEDEDNLAEDIENQDKGDEQVNDEVMAEDK